MTGADGGIALVTGASRGLGLECVRQLLGHGLVVLAGVRDVASGRRALDALGGRDRLRVVPLDVSSPDDVAGCGDVIRRDFGGRLDVLVNNAAVHYDRGQTALTADWRVVAEAIDTNVLGAWRVARMVAPFMQARRRGRIVNVSSSAGAWASLGARTPAYSLSKLALNGLTRMLASELHGSGILVNAVCPGWVATEDGPTGGFFRDGRAIPW